MEKELQNTVALLAHTPATLDALLRDLPDALIEATEGENTWSVRTVVAHLIQGEAEDWIPRAKLILQSGDSQPFSAFDRDGYISYSQGKTMAQLLDEFSRARAKNLDELRALSLTAEDLKRRGIHPALGPVILSQLLATWAAHDLTHLHQISRILAVRYREAVGPWVRFLGVMQCTGHSASS